MEQDNHDQFTREELKNMSRGQIIVLAKKHHINSNQKTEMLISQILKDTPRVLTKEGIKIKATKTKQSNGSGSKDTKSRNKNQTKKKSNGTPKKSEKSSNSGSKTKKSSLRINFNELPNDIQDHIYKSVIYQEVKDKLEQSKYLDYSNVNVKEISNKIIVDLPKHINDLRRLNNQELSSLIIENIKIFENNKIINLIEPQLIKLQQHLQNILNNLMQAFTGGLGIENDSILEILRENPDLFKIEHNRIKINLNDYIIEINNKIKEFWNKYKIKIKDTWLEKNVYAQFSINKLISEINDILEPMIGDIPNASRFLPILKIINNF